MLIYIKLCTHIGRIDVEVAEIPRMLLRSQFILGNPLYIITLTVSAHRMNANLKEPADNTIR
jgi:hypothetical protein